MNAQPQRKAPVPPLPHDALPGGAAPKPDKAERKMTGGRKTRAERIALLEAENRELRARIGIDEPRTLEDWEMVGTQELRDAMAVRALIAEWNSPRKALRRLGFEVSDETRTNAERARVRELIDCVFKTPGVVALLEALTKDLEEAKPELLARQLQIALHGDDDASLRAFNQLAKIQGWQKQPDTLIDNRHLTTIFELVGGEARQKQVALEGSDDAHAFLSHVPGDAVRIDSGIAPETIEAEVVYDDEPAALEETNW